MLEIELFDHSSICKQMTCLIELLVRQLYLEPFNHVQTKVISYMEIRVYNISDDTDFDVSDDIW